MRICTVVPSGTGRIQADQPSLSVSGARTWFLAMPVGMTKVVAWRSDFSGLKRRQALRRTHQPGIGIDGRRLA